MFKTVTTSNQTKVLTSSLSDLGNRSEHGGKTSQKMCDFAERSGSR